MVTGVSFEEDANETRFGRMQCRVFRSRRRTPHLLLRTKWAELTTRSGFETLGVA